MACCHGECTPGYLEDMHRRIAGSQLAIIEDAPHLCFASSPADFTAIVNSFPVRCARVRASLPVLFSRLRCIWQ